MKLKDAYSLEEKLWPSYTYIKKQRHYFADRGLSSQGCGFSSSHVWMWELGNKESWAPKDWCFWTVVLEKTLYSSLDCTEIKAVNSKENKSWIFIERTDAEAESPNFCHLMQRGDSLEKTLVLGKTEGRRRRVDGGWDGWKASPAQWTWVWASSRSWSAAIHGITECQTRLRDWAELIFCCLATTATTIKAESCHLLPHECT